MPIPRRVLDTTCYNHYVVLVLVHHDYRPARVSSPYREEALQTPAMKVGERWLRRGRSPQVDGSLVFGRLLRFEEYSICTADLTVSASGCLCSVFCRRCSYMYVCSVFACFFVPVRVECTTCM